MKGKRNLIFKIHLRAFFFPGLSLLLCSLLLLFFIGFYPIVRFPQEQIDITVYPSQIWVKGTYCYRNPFPFPVTQGFFIPFPIDKTNLEPVFVSANRMTPTKESISLYRIIGKYHFELRFKSKEEVKVQVQYCQGTPKNSARYILKTTQLWKYPLQQGIYRLFPRGVEILSSNYDLRGDEQRMIFHRKNFMPEKDWSFSWRIKS